MSGWVKVEKDLESDPRVLRMSKAIDKRFILFLGNEQELDPCNACALPGVTLVCGALTRLWIYADSHARDDDTLDMGAREIDEWLGIPDFCSLMPKDWLTEIDEHTVELPGYQEHNGTEARKRALTQKRVEQHRTKGKRSSVTARNASALPDQTETRPILEKTIPEQKGDARGEPRAPRSAAVHLPDDFELTPERRAIAIRENLDPERTFVKFKNHWRAASGAKARKRDWDGTWENWCLTEFDRGRSNGNGPHKPAVKAKTIEEIEAEEAARVQH